MKLSTNMCSSCSRLRFGYPCHASKTPTFAEVHKNILDNNDFPHLSTIFTVAIYTSTRHHPSVLASTTTQTMTTGSIRNFLGLLKDMRVTIQEIPLHRKQRQSKRPKQQLTTISALVQRSAKLHRQQQVRWLGSCQKQRILMLMRRWNRCLFPLE